MPRAGACHEATFAAVACSPSDHDVRYLFWYAEVCLNAEVWHGLPELSRDGSRRREVLHAVWRAPAACMFGLRAPDPGGATPRSRARKDFPHFGSPPKWQACHFGGY
jgi:hypothetical protein